MTTTSLKLPDDLKQRTVSAARQLGISPHAFMLDAIEKAALAAERRNQFVAEALAAREALLETGQGYDVGKVHKYLKDRVAGKAIYRPATESWQG
jgi:predicted transcriptional regulator